VLGTRGSGSAPSGSQAKSADQRISGQVVPHSKQLGSQARRCRAEQAAGQVPAEEMRGPASGRAQEGRRSPDEISEANGFGLDDCVLRQIC
jgi:hypothetical protein